MHNMFVDILNGLLVVMMISNGTIGFIGIYFQIKQDLNLYLNILDYNYVVFTKVMIEKA